MKIAIASGKGGTGKTTISTNLASYLSEKQEVVLADLDVEEPNANLFLNLTPDKEIIKNKKIPEWNESCLMCGLCQEVCNFNAIIKLNTHIMILPELCHSCFACSELCPEKALEMVPRRIGQLTEFSDGNLKFYESRMDIGQEQAVPLISQTKEYISQNEGSEKITLFDSPPGTSCPVIEVLKDVDLVLLVTEPTPFGLHDLKLAIETSRFLNRKFAVIINRFESDDNIVSEYCRADNIDIVAKIPNDRRIAELYSTGRLLFTELNSVREEIKKIKEYIFTNSGGQYA